MRVLIFGDSIAQGFWDSYGGWVQRLAHDYHTKTLASLLHDGDFEVQIFNLGISGEQTSGLVKRIEPEIAARLSARQDVAVVVAIGLNNASMRNNRALHDVYEVERDVERIIDSAAKFTDRILCVGLTAVDESLTNPRRYGKSDKQLTNNRINAIEDTIKQAAHRKDVPFIPIHDQFLAALEAGQELLADGLHPNEAGHQLVAELVRPAIDTLIS